MIADIADALLPVSFVMALGFLAGKRRIIDNRNVGSINSLVMGPSWRPALVHPPTVVCHLMADAFGVHVRIAAIEVVAGRGSRRISMRSLSKQICRRVYGRWKLAHRHTDTLPSQREPEAARDREGMASAGER